MQATSADIKVYNDFAAGQITNPALRSLGVTWKALVSTPSVSARKNAPTSTLPIYNTRGQLIARNSSNLWDSSIATSILDQYGQADERLAWTGTSPAGETYFGGWSLGGGGGYGSVGPHVAVVGAGAGGGTGGILLDWQWVSCGLLPWTEKHPVFALSTPITVVTLKDTGDVPGTISPHPRALHFDQLRYAEAPQSTKFTSGDFTISLWLKPDSTGRRGPTVSQYIVNRSYAYRDGQRGDFVLRINRFTSDLDFCLWGDNSSRTTPAATRDSPGATTSTSRRLGHSDWITGWDVPETRMHGPLRFDEWSHVIVTRDRDTYTMWLNGKRVVDEQSTAIVSDRDNTNPFTIGGAAAEPGVHELFKGDLDDFRIFRRCLSEEEIADLFNHNGDETFMQGEGRLHIGPLREAYWKGELFEGEKQPVPLPKRPTEDAPAVAPVSSITTNQALDRVSKAIAPVLDRLNPKPPVERPSQSSLSVSYHTRTYKIHRGGAKGVGNFSAETYDAAGPDQDGFVLSVNVQKRGEVNQLVTPQTLHEPYWTSYLDVTPIDNTDQQIYWVLSYGGRDPQNVVGDIQAKIRQLQGGKEDERLFKTEEGPPISPSHSGLQAAQARYNAAKTKAYDDTAIRYAVAAADVAKKEYEFNVKANQQNPGSVPKDKLAELSLKCTETTLAIELARLQQRLAAEDLKVAKAELDFARGNGDLASVKADSDIDVRYAEAAAAVRKAECEYVTAAEKKAPGSVPKAKLEQLLLQCKEADLALEKAKLQHRADVDAVRIAKAKLDDARQKAAELQSGPGEKNPGRATSNSEVKQISAQRITTLEELLRAVESNYDHGFVNAKFSDIYDAQDKLLNARLDAATSKAERVAIWEKLLETRKHFEEKAEALATSGPNEGSQADFLLAKSERQKAELGLAEEKARSDEGQRKSGEPHPPRTGQKPQTKWTPENIKKDQVGYLRWAIDETEAKKTRLEAEQRDLTGQQHELSGNLATVSADKSDQEALLKELKDAYEKATDKNLWPVVVRNHKFDASLDLKRKIVECHHDLENASKLVETYSAAKSNVADRLAEIDQQKSSNETLRRKLEADLEAAKVQQTMEKTLNKDRRSGGVPR
jgi:hypothetical protein